MKAKIWEWIKAYIINRWLGGNKKKAEAKVRRAKDKATAINKKAQIAKTNKANAIKDLKKTIDELQSKEGF